jgi:hypothetical protein
MPPAAMPPATSPLTLATVLARAYKFLWENRQDFLAYAFLPVVLVAAVKTATLWASGEWQLAFEPAPAPATPGEPGATGDPAAQVLELTAADIVNLVVTMATYVMFAVAWHRKFLLGNEGNTVGAALRWSGRHWKFLGRFLLLLLIIIVASMLLSLPIRLLSGTSAAVSSVAIVAVLMVVGLIYGRLLLIFPAAAIDEPFGLKDSIECTQGKSWLMLGIAVMPPLPAMIVLLIVSLLLGNLFVPLFGASVSLLLVLTLIQQVIVFGGIAAGVTALSIAHRELAHTRPAGTA